MSKVWRHTPPYAQQYRFVVPERFVGIPILDFYCERFDFRSREYWMDLITTGEISVNRQGVDPEYILLKDDVLHTRRPDVTEPDVDENFQILHDADGIFAINKPSPLAVHPAGRYYKNSLVYILGERYPERKFHTIHRLDVWTTGTLVLGVSDERARWLHKQMEKKTVSKVYGVLAKGEFPDGVFEIDEAIGRREGAHRGFGEDVVNAKPSQTRFTTIARSRDGICFLKAELMTGRTNQIRIHLNVAGGHVLNDPVYSPNGDENIEFMGLHCRSMGFNENQDGESFQFQSPWPEHFKKYFSESDLNRCEG